jgi:hypothetical protein
MGHSAGHSGKCAAGGITAAAIQLTTFQVESQERTAGDGVVKRSRAGIQPVIATDRCLNGPAETLLSIAECGVELVSIRFAQDQYVYVADGPLTSPPFVPGSPRSVDVGCADPVDRPQSSSQYGRDAEGPRQNLGQPSVVRAGGVCPNQPRVAQLPAYDQASSFRSLDLPVDRGMRGSGPRRDLSEAEFKIWISQQQRKDLTLLLGAQDGQEGGRWLSIHY